MDKDLLRKLKNIASTECDNDINKMSKSWVCFEICCAIEKSLALKSEVRIWSDIPLEIKSSLGLPIEDVGIDYMDINSTFAGQAKLYQENSLVKACDIERTRLCAYRGKTYSRNLDIMKYCEISTLPTVKLGKCKIESNDIIHNIITKKRMIEIYQKALDLKVIPEEQLVAIKEKKLRKCQIEALKNIIDGRINRIRMACGSGKSRVALEVIKRKPGRYLILVPYITLLEQWTAYFAQFDITTVCIGTGYNGQVPVYNKDRTVVMICVNNSYEKAFYYNVNGYTLQRLFEYVIVDEAHHIENTRDGMNGKLWNVVQSNKNTILLSASLDIEDTKCHYNYSIRNAIDDGVCCDYDIRLSYFNEQPSMKTISKYISQNLEYVSILAYCNSIDSAKKLASACNIAGVKAAFISCEESKKVRKNIIDEFEKGVYRVLASVRTLGEGINIKRADTCMFIDNRNEISAMQCLGRVLRKDEGKKMSHVVIFSSIKGNNDIREDPMVKILRNISQDDIHAVKKSHRIWIDIVQGEKETNTEYERRGIWIKDEIYNSMMKYIGRGNWHLRFDEMRLFYKENGRLPKRGEENGIWLCDQRRFIRNGTLPEEYNKLMNDTFPNWININAKQRPWKDHFEEVRIFYKKEGRLPKQNEENGYWLNNQKRDMKNGMLSQDRKKLLDVAFPTWFTYKKQIKIKPWREHFEEVHLFYKERGRLPKKTEENGGWLSHQKVCVRKGKLSVNHKKMMDDTFPGWLNTISRPWKDHFEEVRTFYKKEGRLPKQREVNGKWLWHQKENAKKGILSKEYKKLMNDTFPGWLNTKRANNL